jgi:LmbE family N-acetylglucosaminyl deacetylase
MRRARSRPGRSAVAALALCIAGGAASAQRWQDLQGRSKSGLIELRQAVLDAGSDGLALLVAAHPDDRYLLPAVYLRYALGTRVAVLLASRGGGAQNSSGPETGDALDRIRTLETEAGCWHFDGAAYYLNRPDLGFRRTAAETFDEWGREETKRELVRLVREIRPDLVITTHNAEDPHGHGLALAALLPEAIAAAGDPKVEDRQPPHRVSGLFLAATANSVGPGFTLHADAFEPDRGAGFRRLAYDILAACHVNPGVADPMESIYAPEMTFASEPLSWPTAADWTHGLPSLFDAGIWPDAAPSAAGPRKLVTEDLAACGTDRARLIDAAAAAIRELQRIEFPPGEARVRARRRIVALQRVVLHANAMKIELEARPGTVAVPGEQVDFDFRVHVGGPRKLEVLRIADGGSHDVAGFEAADGELTNIEAGGVRHATLCYRVPLGDKGGCNPMDASFRGDRFVPPLRLSFALRCAGVDIPLEVAAPLDLRPPVELALRPRMLMCPTNRAEVKFGVEVIRNSAFRVQGDIDVRAPAGYQVIGDRRHVELGDERGDTFDFTLRPVADRNSGVDVIRIALGESRVVLPLHKIDVKIDPKLRVGVVRGPDDTLLSVIGVGGFGLHWSELSDVDLAVRDLADLDTIVVDVRALRDRPAARRSFRRLLDFCGGRGKRLVVFYHKDTEFGPPGEPFVGGPYQPFQIGKERVTHADAPVTVLQPDCCLLRAPNRIAPGDWDGWEQERALYFPGVYAAEYQEILEMSDPGQPARRSALLYARTGPERQGEYVYCALALWRQLKKLHPGSVRLLANLLTPGPGNQ